MSEQLEKISRLIAYWHGQKMIFSDPLEGTQTIASIAGYGRWGDSPVRYAERHWKEYSAAAEAVINELSAQSQDKAR